MLPALALCVLIAAAALPTGWALWSAGEAARAGARAEHVGRDARIGARRSLSGSELLPGFAGEPRVRSRGSAVEVSLPVPALLPGLRDRSIGAAARLDPEGG